MLSIFSVKLVLLFFVRVINLNLSYCIDILLEYTGILEFFIVCAAVTTPDLI